MSLQTVSSSQRNPFTFVQEAAYSLAVGCRQQTACNRQYKDVCGFQSVFVAGNQFSSRFIALDFSFTLNLCCVPILYRRI